MTSIRAMLLVASALGALSAGCAASPADPNDGRSQDKSEEEASQEASTKSTSSALGYSSTPSNPSERCVIRKICRWIHAAPPLRACEGDIRGTDCERFCDYHCVYPIIPLPTVDGIGPVPTTP